MWGLIAVKNQVYYTQFYYCNFHKLQQKWVANDPIVGGGSKLRAKVHQGPPEDWLLRRPLQDKGSYDLV